MRISTFFYSIGQGFKNAFKNKWFTLATIATISCCLFLYGVVFSVIYNIKYTMKNVESGVSVVVFFNDDITDERIAEIGDIINKHSAVDHADYVSGDAAWESFKTEYLGEYADGFTENPLEHSENYQIYLNDISRQTEFVQYMEAIDGVDHVNNSEITAQIFVGFDSIVGYISLGIIGILLFVSIFLISITVTIGISVRKDEIYIMKFVGATDFFVRAPFVVEGVFIGLIGAIIPCIIIYFSYNSIVNALVDNYSLLNKLMVFTPVNDIFYYLFPTSIIIGVGIGFFGSLFTVKKHLRV